MRIVALTLAWTLGAALVALGVLIALEGNTILGVLAVLGGGGLLLAANGLRASRTADQRAGSSVRVSVWGIFFLVVGGFFGLVGLGVGEADPSLVTLAMGVLLGAWGGGVLYTSTRHMHH